MTNVPFESLEALQDVEARNFVEDTIANGGATCYEDVRDAVETVARDNARTPMQWSDDAAAGFTDGDPWLKVNPNYETVNVEDARANPDSVWYCYRTLGELREEHDVLVYGSFAHHYPEHDQLFCYTRTLNEARVLVVLNISDEPATFDVPEGVWAQGFELVLANDDIGTAELSGPTELGPYEARVYLE